MIITETTLTGTEEELLAYFKEKYNLVQSCCGGKPKQEEQVPQEPLKPAVVNNKVTTGFGNLFGGTSWGN